MTSTLEKKSKIEYIKPGFVLHSFQQEIFNNTVLFQIIKMKDSVYVYIGEKNQPQLLNLALAMQNKYDTLPVTTKLLGDLMESNSKNIACKLSKKLNKVVYVSYNLSDSVQEVPVIEKRLLEEIKKYPDKF